MLACLLADMLTCLLTYKDYNLSESLNLGALSRGFCCVQVSSVPKSLLSTFTHIKGHCHGDFAVFRSVLC